MHDGLECLDLIDMHINLLPMCNKNCVTFILLTYISSIFTDLMLLKHVKGGGGGGGHALRYLD